MSPLAAPNPEPGFHPNGTVPHAASSITFVTVPGWEIRDRCEALIFVTVACARAAMNSCAAGGIAWSAVPITSQLGMLAQAGGPDTSVSAVAAIGRWVAARSAASLAGT